MLPVQHQSQPGNEWACYGSQEKSLQVKEEWETGEFPAWITSLRASARHGESLTQETRKAVTLRWEHICNSSIKMSISCLYKMPVQIARKPCIKILHQALKKNPHGLLCSHLHINPCQSCTKCLFSSPQLRIQNLNAGHFSWIISICCAGLYLWRQQSWAGGKKEKTEKNSVQLIQRLEIPHSPGYYGVIFLHLSSSRKAAQYGLEI